MLLLGDSGVAEESLEEADALLGDDGFAIREHLKLSGATFFQAGFDAQFLVNESGETRRFGLIPSGCAVLNYDVHTNHLSWAGRNQTQAELWRPTESVVSR